jgi:competence protein ComEA
MNIHQINVNEAGKTDLATVKGIGPNRAEAIIRQREEQGEFKSIEDLQQRLKIEDEELQQLKEVVVV